MTAEPIALGRSDLKADCQSCFALCCTAFGFARSVDFAEDKPAGTPCRHLGSDHSCTIHDKLRPRGFRGCAVFDCFGAGQTVSQQMFAGVSWRKRPHTRQQMFAAFSITKQLHEMLWYLAEAKDRTYDADTIAHAVELETTITALTDGGPDRLSTVDVHTLHSTVRAVLIGVSEEVRAGYTAAETDGPTNAHAALHAGADLAGVDLRALRLCGADLRGACLIGVDLRDADLAGVDLLGADLRDARLDGADLTAALYVTQPQVNAARGDAGTRLPPALTAPPHWGIEQRIPKPPA